MRALVYESAFSGHYLHFAGLVAEGLVDAGIAVSFATSPAAIGTPAWSRYLQRVEHRIEIIPLAPNPQRGFLGPAKARVAGLRESIIRSSPDYVFLPMADGATQLAAVRAATQVRTRPRFGVPVEALHFVARFAYPARTPIDRAKRTLSRFAATHTPWTITHFNDPIAYEAARHLVPSDRLGDLMPEPVEQRPRVDAKTARERLGIEPDGFLFSIVGTVNESKGADLLLHAFREARLSSEVRLLLAGTLSSGISTLVDSEFADLVELGTLLVKQTFMTRDEFWDVLCASDAICSPYRHHMGSSGIVAYAAYLDIPVLVPRFGWVGEAVAHMGLGEVADPLCQQELIQSLITLTKGATSGVRSDAAQRFVDFNTEAEFQRLWTRRIRKLAE